MRAGPRSAAIHRLCKKRSCEADGMAQREMGFADPFAVEFKRLAYDAVTRKS
jgi:hypothetical protein